MERKTFVKALGLSAAAVAFAPTAKAVTRPYGPHEQQQAIEQLLNDWKLAKLATRGGQLDTAEDVLDILRPSIKLIREVF